jgi:2-polyprenyl-6-methoxyphenol hydroxylase-like FAD-dependent oxidoreductase
MAAFGPNAAKDGSFPCVKRVNNIRFRGTLAPNGGIAMTRFNIAIAGCGPCGLAAALLLHAQGHRITMFERFAQAGPLGSGLLIQPTGLAVLAELGLAGRILRDGARIDRLHGMAGARVVLEVRYAALKGHHFGVGLHRASLFAALHDAVLAHGIPIRTGHAIAASVMRGAGRHLQFQDGRESEGFDLVVDALGAWTPLAERTGRQLAYGALWASLAWPQDAGFDPRVLAQRYRRASTMAGVLPIGMGRAAFFWSLRADRLAAWRAGGLAAWKAQVRALWPQCEPLLAQISDPAQLTFARYAHRTLKRPAAEALIHIGDAWHSTSPQLGQGANMALLDAWALAQGLAAHRDIARGIAAAIAARRRHVRVYQALSWLFTPVYQSDSRVLPFVRDRLVGPLSRLWPATAIQAAMVSGLAGDPLPALRLRAAGASAPPLP